MKQKQTIDISYNNTFDKPVLYNDLQLYPIKVIDNFKFESSISCLLLDQFNDKDIVSDFSILQMSYLDYLFYCDKRNKEDDNNQDIMFMIIILLSIVLRFDFLSNPESLRFSVGKNNKYSLLINDSIITSEDFDNMRLIICMQNDVDLSIFDLDPLVRQNIRATMEMQSKMSSKSECSFEDQIISIMINTSLHQSDIEELTLRKFKKILARVDHQMHYEIYELARVSGFAKFKENYPHWLSDVSKNSSHNVTSYEETKGKVNKANAAV